MTASIRVIKIVKDPVTSEEAYTVELEIEGERSKDLLSEVTACPMGKDLIELLNQAKFLPQFSNKTPEEIREEADKEEEEKEKYEEEIKEEARKELFNQIIDILVKRKKFKDEVEAEAEIKKEMEKMEKEETTDNHDSITGIRGLS